jgi:hypothetical protein
VVDPYLNLAAAVYVERVVTRALGPDAAGTFAALLRAPGGLGIPNKRRPPTRTNTLRLNAHVKARLEDMLRALTRNEGRVVTQEEVISRALIELSVTLKHRGVL